ncbi:MarR family winged helix-turn-helix transcriptional regulator [Roseateles sp.]|jgi:DNA-binding MarR family transcriptional regulator|uniref:MarR family winged helix-turn-helix transcriptional regulator n=1 Tax=Roseateles sp. TaxID=1971397 RepID=UPI0031CFA307
MSAPRDKHPPLDQSRLAHTLGYAIARAAVTTNQLFNQGVGDPLGLRPVEFTLLQLILSNPDTTQKRLCDLLRVPAPQMTLILDRLQERGWVKRERSANDRRALHLRLSPAGARLAEKSLAALQETEQVIDGILTSGERQLLQELLAKVAR